MPREASGLNTFNRGRISRHALARTDIKRVGSSAETQINWMPRVLGSMSLRPGTRYIDTTDDNNFAVHLDFIKALDDTAIIELTNQKMRVRVDETIIQRPAVSTTIANSSFASADLDGSAFSKLTDPSSLPGSAGLCCAFSPDGQHWAVGGGFAGAFKVYSISGTTFTELATPPSSWAAGGANGVAFSSDSTLMAFAYDTTSPLHVVYFKTGSGNTATWTALAAGFSALAGAGRACAFSPDGQWVAFAHDTTPFIRIYKITGTGSGATFVAQSNPAALPAGNATGVAFSWDSRYMAVTHATTPFVTVYLISGTTFTKVAGGDTSQFVDSAGLPAGTGMSVSFSRDGVHMAVAHTTTPFASIYTIGATEFAKLANPSSLPDGNGTSVSFSSDNQFLVVGHATTQFLSIYRYVSSVWTLQTNPVTLPDGNVNAVAFSANNRYLAAAHATSQFITLYEAYNWLDIDQSGATSTLDPLQILILTGTLFNEARRVQAVSILQADINVEHALNITINSGRALVRVGTTFGGEDLIAETVLTAGASNANASYSLSFTPTTSLIFIQFSSREQAGAYIWDAGIASSGDMEIVTPYLAADLRKINWEQSGDVIYLACDGYAQFKIERHAVRSWAFILYLPEDGPFMVENTGLITLTPSALTGIISLTASRSFFRSGHINALFRLTSVGQTVASSFTGANQFSASDIRVTGVGTSRNFTVTRSGTWSATVTLQRSMSAPGSWTDVATFTTNGSITISDELDNQIAYYRIGIKTGDYTSGTAVVTLSYANGGLEGIVRINFVTSGTAATANVLLPLGATTATEVWAEGYWSTYRGFPSAVALYEGRLWWAGQDRIWGSISDRYESFDANVEGDSGTISRSIGEGPVDRFNWILPLQRLILGAQMSEFTAKSSSFDEPLTPSAFSLKPPTTYGSAQIPAIKIDGAGVFVDRTASRIIRIDHSIDANDYMGTDLTQLIPEMFETEVGAASQKIVRIAVQRRPDTRVHCIREDGTAGVLVFDRQEEVICWIDYETDGVVEDVVVMPDAATQEDAVYYTVKRTINSLTKRYFERWALTTECVGGTLNKQLDSFILYSGIATTTIIGLSHLEGETVYVWGNGVNLGSYVVTAGQITGLTASVTSAVIGLTYRARYKSAKLALAAAGGTALNMKKRNCTVGLILADAHHDGLKIGDDFDNMVDMPSKYREETVVVDTIFPEWDDASFGIKSKWTTDSRLCLEANAPKPVTVLCATVTVETSG